MEVLIGVAIFALALIILLIKYKFFKKKATHQEDYKLDIGINPKPLKITYFILSFVILLVLSIGFIKTLSLLFNQKDVSGELVSVECSSVSEKNNNCPDMYKVYVVKYSYNGNEYVVRSAGEGARIHTPSPLSELDLSIGDDVSVAVDNSNPSNSVVSKQLRSSSFFIILYFLLPIILLIHSSYLLFKQKKGGS